jgi:uncharacterized protein YaeQ
MAIKSTVYKAAIQIADMDRGLYADHTLTVARHPSETDERLMARLLAFALNVPADDHDLWQHSLAGDLRHWVEVGQPDDRRLARACGRAERVSLYCYSGAAPIWWAALRGKVARLSNLAVWQIPAEQSRELAALAERSMQLQVTIQDALIWVGNGQRSVEVHPQSLQAPTR